MYLGALINLFDHQSLENQKIIISQRLMTEFQKITKNEKKFYHFSEDRINIL